MGDEASTMDEASATANGWCDGCSERGRNRWRRWRGGRGGRNGQRGQRGRRAWRAHWSRPEQVAKRARRAWRGRGQASTAGVAASAGRRTRPEQVAKLAQQARRARQALPKRKALLDQDDIAHQVGGAVFLGLGSWVSRAYRISSWQYVFPSSHSIRTCLPVSSAYASNTVASVFVSLIATSSSL